LEGESERARERESKRRNTGVEEHKRTGTVTYASVLTYARLRLEPHTLTHARARALSSSLTERLAGRA
jgi:hypothetical protein